MASSEFERLSAMAKQATGATTSSIQKSSNQGSSSSSSNPSSSSSSAFERLSAMAAQATGATSSRGTRTQTTSATTQKNTAQTYDTDTIIKNARELSAQSHRTKNKAKDYQAKYNAIISQNTGNYADGVYLGEDKAAKKQKEADKAALLQEMQEAGYTVTKSGKVVSIAESENKSNKIGLLGTYAAIGAAGTVVASTGSSDWGGDIGELEDEADDLRDKIDAYEKPQEQAEYYDKNVTKLQEQREDNFSGQFNANLQAGRYSEDSSEAWADYVKNPTEASLNYALFVDALAQKYSENNAEALDDENVKASWLSKDLAQYLPQFWNQTKAKVAGGAVGTAAGSLVGDPVGGYKVGTTIASGLQSYNQMLGSAYKNLCDLGADQELTLNAAKNEALLSSIIESADTLADLSLLGITELTGLAKLSKTAVEEAGGATLKSILAKYGLSIGSEGLQEGLQQAISIANRKNVEAGKDADFFELLEDSIDVLLSAIQNPSSDEAKEILEAMGGGAKIATMMGSVPVAINSVKTVSGNINAKASAQASQTASDVQETVQAAQTATDAQESAKRAAETAQKNMELLQGGNAETQTTSDAQENARKAAETAQKNMAMLRGENTEAQTSSDTQESVNTQTSTQNAQGGATSLLDRAKEKLNNLFAQVNRRDALDSLSFGESAAAIEEGLISKSEKPFATVSKTTPQVLIEQAGAEDLPIIMSYDNVYLASRHDGEVKGHYHNLGPEIMEQIAEKIGDPVIMVRLKNGRINEVIPVTDKKGRRVLVSIELSTTKDLGDGQGYKAYNLVVTTFGASENNINNIVSNPDNEVIINKSAGESSQVNPQLNTLPGIVNEDTPTDVEGVPSNDIIRNPETKVKPKSRSEIQARADAFNERAAKYAEDIERAKNGDADDAEIERLYAESDWLNAEWAELQAEIRRAEGSASKAVDTVDNHIDRRDFSSVAARNVKAFQFDHPQLHEYFVEAANELLTEVQRAEGQAALHRYGKASYHGPVETLLGIGLSKPRITKCLVDIINNNGVENYADAKRVEIVLNDMLSNGWRDMTRASHEANAEYIAAKDAIAGAVKGGSWEKYLQDHEDVLTLGEATEDELRAEWEADALTLDAEQYMAQQEENKNQQGSDSKSSAEAAPAAEETQAPFAWIKENHEEAVQRLNALLQSGSITTQEYNERLAALNEQYQELSRTLGVEFGEDSTKYSEKQQAAADAKRAAETAERNMALLRGENVEAQGVQTAADAQQSVGDVNTQESAQDVQGGATDVAHEEITPEVATSDTKKIRNLIPATIGQIRTFISKAFKNENDYQLLKISDANENLVNILANEGIDISGYSHILRDNDIRHINKSHGEFSNDKYKVSSSDLINVQNVIDNYDNLYLGYKTKDGNPTIVYEKKIGTRTFYVEEILDDGGLGTKQMVIVGEKSNPSFLRKYKKIDSKRNRTDVAEQSRTKGQSPPSNHVQDAAPNAANDGSHSPGTSAESTSILGNAYAPNSEGVPSNNSIPDGERNVNSNSNTVFNAAPGEGTENGTPKLSKFWENTLKSSEEKAGTPDEVSAPLSYLEKSEKQSLAEASARLSEDRQATIEGLLRSEAWSGVQTDAAMQYANELYSGSKESGDWSAYTAWRKVLQEHVTKTAQGLQALSKYTRSADPSTGKWIMDQIVDSINEDRGLDITIPDALRTAFAEATTDEERNAAIDQINQYIADNVPATLTEKINALRYLNMLGNVKTQARNIIGNAANIAYRKVSNSVAELGEIVTGAERTKSVFAGRQLFSEAWNDYANVRSEAMGEGKYTAIGALADDIESKRKIFKSKGLESYRRATNWAMDMGDQIFSRTAYADALGGWLKAHGIKSISDATEEQLQRGRAYAIKEAQEATFRDTNAVSEAFSKLQYRGKNKVLRGISKIGEAIQPFRKTPANVTVRAVEASPIGLMKSLADTAKKLAGKSDLTGSEIISEFAKGLTGSGIYMLGFAMAAAGKARGTEDDEDLDDFQKQQGAQDWSIDLNGDGKSVTFDWATPLALPFAMGIKTQEVFAEQGFSFETALDALGGMSDVLLNMSMMSGVNDALDNLASYNGDSDALPQFLLNSAVSYLTQLLQNSALRQLEQASQQYRMTSYTDYDSNISKSLQYQFSRLSSGILGWDYNQTEYIDAWGRKQDQGEFYERLFNSALNPAYTSKDRSTEIDAELERLYTENKDVEGFPNVLPQTVARSTKIGGEYMSAEEYEQYSITRGQTSLELATDFINSTEYKTMSDEQRAETLSELYKYAATKAENEILDGRGEEQKSQGSTLDGLEESDVAKYLAYSELLNSSIEDEDYIRASALLGDWEDLSEDVKAAVKESNSDMDNLLYAKEKHVSVAAYYTATDAVDDIAEATGRKTDAASAVAINAKMSSYSDAEKLTILETVLTPSASDGKRNTTVRRYEAAMGEGISFDTWTKFTAALSEQEGTAKKYVYAAAREAGIDEKLAYKIYKSGGYASDEERVSQYDTTYSEENGSDEEEGSVIGLLDYYTNGAGARKKRA